MSEHRKQNAPRKGSLVYENWTVIEAQGAYEVPLFTDAPIKEFFNKEYGPYLFMHTGHPPAQRVECIPAIILRIQDALSSTPGFSQVWRQLVCEGWEDETKPPPKYPQQQSDMDRYHGGFLHDEVAALASLCLGIRLKAGGVSRRCIASVDKLGRPTARDAFRTPTFLSSFFPALIILHAVRPTTFAPDLLANLLDLKPEATTALTKAARLYHEALWVAESSPEQTWLWLVSAVETAANYGRKEGKLPKEHLRVIAEEQLRISHTQDIQELVGLLDDRKDEKVFNKVADIMAPLLQATRRFIAFSTQFGFKQKIPPEPRPPVEGQFEWTRENFQRAMGRIYKHRSDALHAGQAFPYPICRPAEHREGWEAPEEKPLSKVEHQTATWEVQDMPLYLHMFAYIVQRTLCAWWEQKCPTEAPAVG